MLSEILCPSLRSGAGWSSVDPVCASDLQARVSEGEFWLEEDEFMSQFDDVTVGYPISEEGHLRSIYTGYSLTLVKRFSIFTTTEFFVFVFNAYFSSCRKSFKTQTSAGRQVDERVLCWR